MVRMKKQLRTFNLVASISSMKFKTMLRKTKEKGRGGA